MEPIIRRCTVTPYTVTKTYYTTQDNQEFFTVMVLEGEEPEARDNYMIEQICITSLRKAPAGQVGIDMTFTVDADGIFTVHVTEQGRQNAQASQQRGSNLTDNEVEYFKQDIANYYAAEQDQENGQEFI